MVYLSATPNSKLHQPCQCVLEDSTGDSCLNSEISPLYYGEFTTACRSIAVSRLTASVQVDRWTTFGWSRECWFNNHKHKFLPQFLGSWKHVSKKAQIYQVTGLWEKQRNLHWQKLKLASETRGTRCSSHQITPRLAGDHWQCLRMQRQELKNILGLLEVLQNGLYDIHEYLILPIFYSSARLGNAPRTLQLAGLRRERSLPIDRCAHKCVSLSINIYLYSSVKNCLKCLDRAIDRNYVWTM